MSIWQCRTLVTLETACLSLAPPVLSDGSPRTPLAASAILWATPPHPTPPHTPGQGPKPPALL